MNYKKFAAAVSGIALLATSLAPISASALSTASMTLSGSANTTGNFTVTVYEDTGADTVTGANVVLDFSGPVSGVSYDYSVGPFVAVTPSGAHNAYGEVTGQQPVAAVHFTVASPATVTASVDAASYLKHAGTSSIESFTITRGSADFTYTAPAPAAPSQPAQTKTTTNTTKAAPSTTPPATTTTQQPVHTSDTPTQAPTKNTKPNNSNAQSKHIKSHHAGVVTSTVSALVIIGAAVYWLVIRKRETVPAPAPYKLHGTTKNKGTAQKTTAARSKSANTASRKPAAKKTKKL